MPLLGTVPAVPGAIVPATLPTASAMKAVALEATAAVILMPPAVSVCCIPIGLVVLGLQTFKMVAKSKIFFFV